MDSAYFDRIIDDEQVVLLLESTQENIILPRASLPEGSEPGHWFLLDFENNQPISILFDATKTNEMANNIQIQLSRLQSKKKSRFKRR